MNESNKIIERELELKYPGILDVLLLDHSSNSNIIWATDDYSYKGVGFLKEDPITKPLLLGTNAGIIKARSSKDPENQWARSKDRAEIFTPSWVCNIQNNLIDYRWFGGKNVFNQEREKDWKPTGKIIFTSKKEMEKYVEEIRLEIACGEAPYLVSRYDAVTGEPIEIKKRIGLLDRKLRAVGENFSQKDDWVKWAMVAIESVYGFDFQGDNVLIARENLLYSFLEYFQDKFGSEPNCELLKKVAEIISWNIFQMDGTKGVIPFSCHSVNEKMTNLFGEEELFVTQCCGCESGDITKHNGIYSMVMDWRKNEKEKFVDSLSKGAKKIYGQI